MQLLQAETWGLLRARVRAYYSCSSGYQLHLETEASGGRCRWAWAVRKLVLRRRSGLPAEAMEQAMILQKAALPFSSFVGIKSVGPQIVACCYLPPADRYPGHPDYKPAPPAKLHIQVLARKPGAKAVCLWQQLSDTALPHSLPSFFFKAIRLMQLLTFTCDMPVLPTQPSPLCKLKPKIRQP